jgi:hypothetical protein
MRYTLRSSSSKNLVGPLEFKRSKIINLDTIQEEIEEDTLNINWFILYLGMLTEVIVLFYMFYLFDRNKEVYINNTLHIIKFSSNTIITFLHNISLIGFEQINQLHLTLCNFLYKN